MRGRGRPVVTLLVGTALLGGCASARTTHTARTAKEQLLISNSVDQALDKVDFTPFGGHPVYLEEKYMESVDKNYVIASVRHRLLHAGATLATKADEAQIIVEVRSGGVGTDNQEMFFGTPEFKAPVPLMPVSIPEVKLISKNTQTGMAKIGIVAYDAKTKQVLGSGGMTLARSDDCNWFFLGMGPYQQGSIHKETDEGLAPPPSKPGELPLQVAFEAPATPAESEVQFASSDQDQTEKPSQEPAELPPPWAK